MKIQQVVIDKNIEILSSDNGFSSENANLVLAFGERELLEYLMPYELLKSTYPNSQIVICSSAGQFSNNIIVVNKVVATAISFEKTEIKLFEIDMIKTDGLLKLGEKLESEILNTDLKALLVLSEGTTVNGTELINKIISVTESKIPVFGGLAGDGEAFQKTLVGLNANASEGKIVMVGFYGNAIRFGFGSGGGWSDFGPEREVTKSDKNILYKIGDRYALDLYKEYLGQYSKDLPASALYFPLSMKENEKSEPVVRTILAINEEEKSMTFAGNIPQGSFIRLMKGNFDKLIDAAYHAGNNALLNQSEKSKLALIVSCVGRKIVLGNRIEEELELSKNTLGDSTTICGFYSYGEFSPNLDQISCELHNQTITITTLSED